MFKNAQLAYSWTCITCLVWTMQTIKICFLFKHNNVFEVQFWKHVKMLLLTIGSKPTKMRQSTHSFECPKPRLLARALNALKRCFRCIYVTQQNLAFQTPLLSSVLCLCEKILTKIKLYIKAAKCQHFPLFLIQAVKRQKWDSIIKYDSL